MAVVINSTTGEIDLDQTTPGIYVVTYTVQGVSYTQEVTVNAVDDSTFSYSASAFCPGASNQTPSITTPGGAFTTQDITFYPFKMQFDTSGGKTITIPNTVGSSFTVDWGDTTVTTETGGTISHTYASGIATSTVSIGATGDTGPFTMFRFDNGGSKSDLLDVPQWGSIVFDELHQMFEGCNNTSFQISATDAPTFSNTGNLRMSDAFYGATYFNSDINHWDVSNLTGSGRDMFAQATNFNQNLSSWVINTQNIQYMFLGTSMSADSYTDTLVGWAVTVYKNSGTPNIVNWGTNYRTFTGTKTSDAASGQTYAVKYGSDWPSDPAGENWTTAQDAKNYLTTSIASGGAQWTIG